MNVRSIVTHNTGSNPVLTTKIKKYKNYEKSIIVTNNGIIHSKNKFTTF